MARMAALIDPAVVTYAEDHSTEPPDYLQSVWDSTVADFPMWGMMVGRQEGRFLEMMVYATKAKRILEIGTFTGYSSIAMAAGLSAKGTITTLEVDEHHAATAQRNIEASPYADRITIKVGPALESLSALEGPFDLVFIDADKVSYDAYFEAVLPMLGENGVVLVDNTLQGGGVLPGRDDDSPNVVAIRAFNEKIVNDPRVVCAFATIRDGITMIRLADG
jgi:caffeoyl-CoA O-methyltransferase